MVRSQKAEEVEHVLEAVKSQVDALVAVVILVVAVLAENSKITQSPLVLLTVHLNFCYYCY